MIDWHDKYYNTAKKSEVHIHAKGLIERIEEDPYLADDQKRFLINKISTIMDKNDYQERS